MPASPGRVIFVDTDGPWALLMEPASAFRARRSIRARPTRSARRWTAAERDGARKGCQDGALAARLFDPKSGGDQPEPVAQDELRTLRIRRRQLINNIGSLRAYGFDTLAKDDEQALKSLDRKILALQVKSGVAEESDDAAA